MQSREFHVPEPMAGGLCYLLGPISGIYFLYSKGYRSNRFIRFHAWQSIFFSLGGILALSLIIGLSVLLPLEYVGWALFAAFACTVVLTLVWFRAIMQALSGQEWDLPLAGSMARARR